MTEQEKGRTPSPLFVVVDVGCHECGVGSEPVGIYFTEDEAKAAAKERDRVTGQWRDVGQTFALVFAMTAPASVQSEATR